MRPIGKSIYGFLLAVALILFIGFKIPDLGLPYFWDELGVYSRASYYLAEHGLGLLPSQLPPGLSRGHPLLFSFIYGTAYKLTGFNVYAGHVVSLAVSVILLLSIYHIVTKLSGQLPALLAVCLLIVQPVFYAQSVLVLPEMLLTLFTLWSLYCYYRQHFIGFAVFACVAILIKESAITIPVAVLSWSVLNSLFGTNPKRYLNLRVLLLVLSPLLLFALFLCVQKYQNGWYFFPEHAKAVSFSWKNIWGKLSAAFSFLFLAQGRGPWLFILLVSVVFMGLKAKLKMNYSFAALAIIFIAVYLGFCVFNFYMDRYLLVVVPLITALVVLALRELYDNIWFLTFITIILMAFSICYIQPDRFNYDCDMSYKMVLAVEQQAGDYIAANVDTTSKVVASFPMNLVLFNPNTGFDLPRHYAMVRPGPDADYLVEDNEVGPVNVSRKNYAVVKTFRCGFAEVSISRCTRSN